MPDTHIISIGYAGRLLDKNSPDFKRLLTYSRCFADMTVVVFTKRSDGYEEVIQEENLTIRATHSKTTLSSFFTGITLIKKALQTYKETSVVVTVQDPFKLALVAYLAIPKSIPLVCQVHGDYFSNHTKAIKGFWRWFGLRALRRAKVVRVVSKRIEESLISHGVSSKNIKVLPINYSVDELLEVGRNKVYSTAHPLRLLFVGRLAPEKNISLILRAVQHINRDSQKVILTIVGDGPLHQDLISEVQDLGISDQVEFIGWVNSTAKYFAEADTFVLASHHEGWGMVLLEAAAAGLPIMTTDVGCVNEVLSDGVEVEVAEVGNKDMYIQALSSFIGDSSLRKERGLAAYRRVSNLTPTEKKYVELWVDVMRDAKT